MTPELFTLAGINPALSLLPEKMDSVRARAMLFAIAYQESNLTDRLQMGGGPGRSYMQFEAGGVRAVLKHPRTRDHARAACRQLDIEATEAGVYVAIGFNDVLACVFSRLLMWSSPIPQPRATEDELGWRLYVENWRPGKPRPEKWADSFRLGWVAIQPTPEDRLRRALAEGPT